VKYVVWLINDLSLGINQSEQMGQQMYLERNQREMMDSLRFSFA
jgi:hypothetical protein